MSPAATGAAFDLSQKGAGDINDRVRSKATSALDALSPSSQSSGAKEGRYDRMQSSLRRNPALNARVLQNNATQAERIKLQEAQESESNYLRVFRDVGDTFGVGNGSSETQLRRFDQTHLFGENIGSKVVIANGNKN